MRDDPFQEMKLLGTFCSIITITWSVFASWLASGLYFHSLQLHIARWNWNGVAATPWLVLELQNTGYFVQPRVLISWKFDLIIITKRWESFSTFCLSGNVRMMRTFIILKLINIFSLRFFWGRILSLRTKVEKKRLLFSLICINIICNYRTRVRLGC